MGRQERMDHDRDEGDYASLLGDEEYGEEEVEEEDAAEPLPERQDEDFSQECQEYYERRERLKELERQRFRRTHDNGRNNSRPAKKPLPYDNYGNFFGPSEPIVARRIIADVRARETASKVAARQAQEVTEPHRVSKGSSGTVSEWRAAETPKLSKAVNEVALRQQRMKEARDYSFLFTDEDPTASPPHDEAQTSTKERQGDNRTKQTTSSAKGSSGAPSRGPNSAKPIASHKTSVGIKASSSKRQERHPASTAKLSKPPERPPILKSKVSSQSGPSSNLTKTTSGPGRPPQSQQSRPSVATPGLSNGKKPPLSSVTAQLKSLVASGPKGVGKQPLASTSAKSAPGKGALLKSTPIGSSERKLPQVPGSKSQVSTARPDQKRPGVVTVGRGVSMGHDQKRSAQAAALPKTAMKPPPKTQKRPRESESEDSFFEDDDDVGDVSMLIRNMFRYNPNKYRDIDDMDDRLMETSFHKIQEEERRSARIAREEDDRELALIEEEERRERERAKKKRKQQR